MEKELWNKEIEEAKIKFNWTNEEMVAIYKITTKIIENIKAKCIKAIMEV